MREEHRRHDLEDGLWLKLEPLLPGQSSQAALRATLTKTRAGPRGCRIAQDADCTKGCELIRGIPAEYVLGDKAYDTNEIEQPSKEQKIGIVIPSKKNRMKPRMLERPGPFLGAVWAKTKSLYQLRHIIENTFCEIKKWRGIAFRFSKNIESFMAALQVRCILMWLKIS
ncbi:MAG: transposase [Deinococcaceae bacterium]